MSEIKRTILYDEHVKLGAKLVPFAGFEMPVNYLDGIKNEYYSVRNEAGLFDVCHMGEFYISGENALEFMQKVTVNDVSTLAIGDAQYSAMCNPKGGIIDDVILYRFPNGYFMVVNASNIQKNLDWLNSQNTYNVKIENKSDDYSLIALQGPNSRNILSKFTDADLTMKFYSYIDTEICGEKVMLSRTGYTGELGFEIYGNPNCIKNIWKNLINVGVKPAGLASRDMLRMEMKYCLYGNDIDQNTNPLEAGLSWISKINKGNFIGRDSLLKVKEEGLHRRLVTFELLERGIPRKGYVIQKDGEEIGVVTSGTQSPSLLKGIGIGYIKKGFTKSNTEIEIMIRNKPVKAKIVLPPFVKNTSLMD